MVASDGKGEHKVDKTWCKMPAFRSETKAKEVRSCRERCRCELQTADGQELALSPTDASGSDDCTACLKSTQQTDRISTKDEAVKHPIS